MKVSVAMCTYNGARYISEQLRSIVTQSRQPDEVVICDDGSNDETVAIVSQVAACSSVAVRLWCNDGRLGPAKNFERAIGYCTGDIILLCDQDDVWKQSKVSQILKSFEDHPDAAYVFSDAELLGEVGSQAGQTLWGILGLKVGEFTGTRQLHLLLKKNVVTGATMAIRSPFRSAFLPIPAGWMHDYWIASLGSALCYGVAISKRLLIYRRHREQVCGAQRDTFLRSCRLSFRSDKRDAWDKVEAHRALIRRLECDKLKGKVKQDRLQLLKEKELHLVRRAEVMSSVGLTRIRLALGEALTGRYADFSDSHYSLIRDLLGG